MREFGGDSALLSLSQFWLETAPILVGILLLTVLVIIWRRQWAIDLRARVWKRWCQSCCGGFVTRNVWPALGSVCEFLLQLLRRLCLCLFCCSCTDGSRTDDSCTDGSLPRHNTEAGETLPQPTPQSSGSGRGGGIPLVMGPLPVSSSWPSPRPLSQQQRPSSGAYLTHPMSTSNANGSSIPLSSVGWGGAPSLPPTSGWRALMPHSQEGEVGEKLSNSKTLVRDQKSSGGSP